MKFRNNQFKLENEKQAQVQQLKDLKKRKNDLVDRIIQNLI